MTEPTPNEMPDQLVLPWDLPAPVRVPAPVVPPDIVLIDFENTQPKNLHRFLGLPVRVYVFTGENQSKISLDLAAAMQQLGDNATYVRMSGSGPSALDFHIAFYIGELAVSVPDAHFYIVSGDRGFDPLVAHLNNRAGKRIAVTRVGNFEHLPTFSSAPQLPPNRQLTTVLTNLRKREKSLPKSMASLEASIRSLFGSKATPSDVTRILEELQEQKIVTDTDGKLTYVLPVAPNGSGGTLAARKTPK